jgi:meso-butanediol dehydrogenase/(S,S)-butanediol dehydrogenase/diacetyl reductase
MRRLENRVAIITGAAAGIGRATAQRFADEGAALYLTDVEPVGLKETAEDCRSRGAAVEYAVSDVRDQSQVEGVVNACVAAHGGLNAVANIAGILAFGHSHEFDPELFRRIIDVNLTGTFLMCRAALPHLLEKGGAIINISSTSALRGLAYGTAYSASKGGVRSLSQSLAVEYGAKGVRVNSICPGAILTKMAEPELPEDTDYKLIMRHSPLGDVFRGPEHIASMVALLASDEGLHINGEFIRIDGGALA